MVKKEVVHLKLQKKKYCVGSYQSFFLNVTHPVILFCISSFIVIHSLYILIVIESLKMAPCCKGGDLVIGDGV